MSMTGIKIAFGLMTLIAVAAKSQNITPEWKEPKGLVLVYPKDLPDNRSELTAFYEEFIKSILSSTSLSELTIVIRPTAKKEIETFIHSLNSKIQVRFFETKNVQDIWARDYCPIYFSNQTVCKALYKPSYFEQRHLKYADLDNKVGINLAEFLNLQVKHFSSNLILDGGNFIHNGKGTAIVTNRVITDNENISIDSIKENFKSQLNITDLIFVPVEPEDETGHIDGMVRFIDEQTVLVASYPDNYLIGKRFLDNLADTLSKKFKVVRIENSSPKNDNPKFASATGNYINFLRIGKTIFLPQYNEPKQDSKAQQIFNNNFPDLTVVPIQTNVDKLSKLGGVFNCISWTYY